MWQETDNQLTRDFTFAGFSGAFAFMTRVAHIPLPDVVSSQPF